MGNKGFPLAILFPANINNCSDLAEREHITQEQIAPWVRKSERSQVIDGFNKEKYNSVKTRATKFFEKWKKS